MNSRILFSLPLLLLPLSLACSDDDPAGAGGAGGTGGGGVIPDPAADACEHMDGGPFSDVTATDDPSTAPDAGEEHTAFNITLPGDAMTGYVGYVSYPADEAGEFIFYADTDVTMSLQDASGTDVPWEETCTSGCTDACTVVANAHTADLDSVGTYALRIESTGPDVTLVVVHAGEHEHEE